MYLTGLPPRLAPLAKEAAKKTKLAFRPGTTSSYQSMFRLFIAFTVFMQVSLLALQPMTIVAYLQFLASNGLSSPTLANHLGAIKANLSLYGIPTLIFQDPRIKYFQRAVTLRSSFKPALKTLIDIDTLQLMVRACDATYMGQVFKAVYTLAFFSFLRLSNLVPHSIKAFSPLFHLARGDILFANPGLHIIVKWSKTIQDRKSVKILKIPDLGSNPICPVMAIKNLLQITPGSNNSPLFQYKTSTKWLPLTDNQVRRHFKNLLSKLNLQNSNLTFHAFRRSGASFAFNSNVPLQHIQSHGTWTSECVWRYITLDHNSSHEVAKNFQKHLYLSPTH